jgi:hypothetical protein
LNQSIQRAVANSTSSMDRQGCREMDRVYHDWADQLVGVHVPWAEEPNMINIVTAKAAVNGQPKSCP